MVRAADVAWVVASGQYSPRLERRVPAAPQVGLVNGLALAGPNQGILLEIEATAQRAPSGRGRVVVTGVVEEEELGAAATCGAGRAWRGRGWITWWRSCGGSSTRIPAAT